MQRHLVATTFDRPVIEVKPEDAQEDEQFSMEVELF